MTTSPTPRRNELWPSDRKLFEALVSESISHEELNFFQNMQFKEENELTLSNDLIMSEDSNTDRIYIVREIYDEYVIGCASFPDSEVHVMSLSEALQTPLSEIGLIDRNGQTLWEWLRSINYAGINYNKNYDNM
ncbi:MAG: hypothetical protein K2G64_02990 [Muribaculaceae bacterium]|nr:hypothetical protein [Muribaculaceae bacterium]MDE5968050.1 hypothetical protein [Muribaculaceae bacterium]MDE7393084.1 hypothetical protein [Muribaculaceae bacterium]